MSGSAYKNDACKHPVPYIDHNIRAEENIPENLKYMISDMEYLDENDPDLYFNRIDDFWVNLKNAYAAGLFSERAYKQMESKYIGHALSVLEREEENGDENI